MQAFYELLKRDKKHVMGLMSGTSVDGIDVVIVEITGHGLETEIDLIAFETVPFPPGVPQRILALCHPNTGRVDEICEMNFYTGHLFAEATKYVLQKNGMPPSDISLIGSHGQTIQHLPSRNATLQIGEPAVIAHETGIPTIADFRVADMAAGGQGAPLVAYPDYLLFRDPIKTVGLLNIGGIANLTVLPAGGGLDAVFASDTGPGNMCIDAVVQEITGGTERYDRDGTRAAQGTPSQPLIEEWLKHPFFEQHPPKTTGRETFGTDFAMECLTACREHGLSDNDAIATLTELTVQTICHYIAQIADIHTLYVSGGGVHNRYLFQSLSELLVDTDVERLDIADAKEAIAFAILANEALHGHSGNCPSATGASVRKILGKFVCP